MDIGITRGLSKNFLAGVGEAFAAGSESFCREKYPAGTLERSCGDFIEIIRNGMPPCDESAAAEKLGIDWTHEDFGELMENCGGKIFAFCCKRLGEFDGLDATQETFMNAWNGKAGFDPDRLGPGGLKGWLGSIARHVCSNVLRKRHPSLIKIGNKKHANAVVNSPIVIPLYVSPSVAVFSALHLPLWLQVDRKPTEEPAARQFLRGLPPVVGRFELTLIAEHDTVQATQELVLTVSAEALSTEVETEEREDAKNSSDQKIVRAKHETIQDGADFVSDFSPTFGAEMDVEWLLACLCEREKQVIIRTFWSEQTDEEIEAALGLNKGHVKGIRWRAMQKLRRRGDDDSSPGDRNRPIR